MKYLLSIFLSGVASLSLFAAPPKIIAPATAEVGDVIQVKLDSAPIAVDWHITCGGKGVSTIVLPDGSLVFGSGAVARKVKISAAVAYSDDDKKTTKAALLEAVTTVGTPSPEPSPTPTPSPSLPDGKFGLAKFVYGLVGTADANGKKALADSFVSLQSAIQAGRFVKIEDILSATAQANRDALTKAGVATTGFTDFFTKLQDKLFAMYQAGTLKNNDDVATAWGEIATGLGAK